MFMGMFVCLCYAVFSVLWGFWGGGVREMKGGGKEEGREREERERESE